MPYKENMRQIGTTTWATLATNTLCNPFSSPSLHVPSKSSASMYKEAGPYNAEFIVL